MPVRRSVLALVAIAGLAPTLHAQHLDISPTASGGQIHANGWDDGTSTLYPGVRVFGLDFQEDPADPYYVNDPGFNAITGSGLPAGSRVGFQILDDLRFWDGTGAVSFGAVPASETLRLNFGSNNRTAGTGTGVLSNLFFGPTVSGSGTFHQHLNSYLQGSDGNSVPAGPGDWGPGDGVEPTTGIYLAQLRVTSDNPGLTSSLPLWLVYNNGLTEATHDEAIDYVQNSVVPEPGTLALVGLGALAALRRRRQAAARVA